MSSLPRATFVARAYADDASSADRAHRVTQIFEKGSRTYWRDSFDLSLICALSGQAH
jgi:hypothetical protein